MGKATVTGGGAAGLYSVQLDLGAARKAAAVAKFNQLIAQLDGRIARQQVKFDREKAREDQLRDALDAAITAYAEAAAADPTSSETKQASEVVQRAQEALVEQVSKTAEVRVPLQLMKAERTGLQTKLQAMQAVEAQRNANAWCVDLTEDAAGEVATIEVPGEPQQLLIAPGGRPPAADDGFLLARGVMSPEQAFFNAAILPGWQKWKPMYRTGTLTALDTALDTASVQLDVSVSSAHNLPVNRRDLLESVPVSYMTCNAGAFAVGDRVVVQFDGMNWDGPRVIGFVSNPRACLPRYVDVEFSYSRGAWADVGSSFLAHTLVARQFAPISYVQVSSDPISVAQRTRPARVLAGPGWHLSDDMSGISVNGLGGVVWEMSEGTTQFGTDRIFAKAIPYRLEFLPDGASMTSGAWIRKRIGLLVPNLVGYTGVALDEEGQWQPVGERIRDACFPSTEFTFPNEWGAQWTYEAVVQNNAPSIEAALQAVPESIGVSRSGGAPVQYGYLGVRWRSDFGVAVMRFGRPGWTEE